MRLTDQQVIAARDYGRKTGDFTEEALATEVLESRAALAEHEADKEQAHQEGYDEGYREGQSDAAGAQSDFWRMMLRYFDKHGIEPASDDGEGYSAHQMMDALHEHESEVDAAHQAEIERLHSALTDLVSWVPERPTSPVWQLEAGVHGADDAIAAARKALGRDAT